MNDHKAVLEPLYEAYNRRDVPAMLSALAPQVQWTNVIEGGALTGRDAVGDYWRSQFALMSTETHPMAYTPLPDGRLRVEVDQTVRKLDGQVWANERVVHTFTFDTDGLILRMDPS